MPRSDSSVCAFDIERMLWWTAHSMDFLHAIVSDKKDYILSLFPHKETQMQGSHGRTAEYISFGNGGKDLAELRKNSILMTSVSSRILRQFDTRITQNGLGYDFPQCAKTGVFTIGSDGSSPRKIPFRRVMNDNSLECSRDAIDLDLVWMGRGYFIGSFLPDAKLETLANFMDSFLHLDCRFKKLFSYEEQNRLVEKCMEGDPQAIKDISVYNYNDAITTKIPGEALRPVLDHIASEAKISRFDAYHQVPADVALMSSRREHWRTLHKERDERDVDLIRDKIDPMDKFRKATDELMHFDKAKGIERNVLVAYAPWKVKGLKDVVNAQDAPNVIAEYMFERVNEGRVEELLCDLELVKQKPITARFVEGKYHTLIRELNQALSDAQEGMVARVCRSVVNRYNNLYFLRNMPEESARSLGFVPFGYADVLSLGKEQVVYRLRGELCSSGVLVPSEKRCAMEPGTNRNSSFKINLERKCAELCLENPNIAIDIVRTAQFDLLNGRVPEALLRQRIIKRRDTDKIGVLQQRNISGQVLEEFPAEEGESIIYLKGKEKYLRHHQASGVRDEGELHLEMYAQDIMGNESLVLKLLSAATGKKKAYLSEELAR